MFIDYLTVMLVNMAAGLAILAIFVLKYLNGDRKKLAPGFLVSGFVATVTGLHEIFTWPIVSSYNIPFGEMSVLYGVLMLAGGIALFRGWDLLSLGIYATFAGAASILLGIRLYSLKMTSEPLIAMGGFVLTGLMGVLSLPVYYVRQSKLVRILATIALLGAAAIWAFTAALGYWAHLENFAKWAPSTMPPAPVK
jgi:putative membrane protein